MSPEESHIKMSLETHTRSTTPSTAPTTPAAEEEGPLGAAPESQSPTALMKIAPASTPNKRSPQACAQPTGARERFPPEMICSVEERLARPCLLRPPHESYRKSATNGRTMKPLKAAVAGLSGASGGGGSPGEEFEMEKERVRALGVEIGKLKLPAPPGSVGELCFAAFGQVETD